MPVNNITQPGIPAFAPPGIYTYLTFANGGSGGSLQNYTNLILANITSQGSASGFTPGVVYGPDTLVSLQTVSDAVSLFGPGSPAHLMYAALRAKNALATIYVAPVATATGTAASQTVSITATGASPQTSGVIQYQIDGKQPCQAVYAATDAAPAIATALALAINGNINLPVTASAGSNVVTILAKVVGARGNNLRGFANVVSPGTGVTVAGAVNSPTYLTSGAGSDGAGYANTLNAIAVNGNRYYYVIPEAGGDVIDGYANGIAGTVQNFIDQQALPANGERQRAVFGSNDTVAHTSAVATSLNDPRCEIVQCNKLDISPGELAATWVGALTNFETAPLTAAGVNFDGFGADAESQPFWNVPAPLDGSAPSQSDIQSCIINGVSPLQVIPGRKTKVVKRVTTRWFSLGGSGNNQSVLDLRITDAGVVTVCDQFFDTVTSALSQTFFRKMIGQDPVSSAPPAPPGIVTVDKVRDVVIRIINQFGAAGLVNAPSVIAGLIVQQNNPPQDSTIGIVVPLFVNSLCHVFLVNGQQTVLSI